MRDSLGAPTLELGMGVRGHLQLMTKAVIQRES